MPYKQTFNSLIMGNQTMEVLSHLRKYEKICYRHNRVGISYYYQEYSIHRSAFTRRFYATRSSNRLYQDVRL